MSEQFVGYCSFERKEDKTSFSNIARISSEIQAVRDMIDKDGSIDYGEVIEAENQIPDLNTDLGKCVWDFYNNLKSLYELASVSDLISRAFVTSFFQNMIMEHSEKNFPVVETFKEVPIFGLDFHNREYVERNIKRWDEIDSGFSKLPQAVLLSIVASFDTAFSEYCKILLKSRPERLAKGDKKYSLSEMLKMGSFDKALDAIVDDEINQIMRKSHFEQVDYFEKMFNISIKSHYKRWGNFVEIFERRNLCAHGNLIVNEIYVENCNKNSYSVDLSMGDILNVDSEYLKSSLDILIEFGILLAFSSWQKQVPTSILESFEAIVEISFNLLTDHHPTVAANILEYALAVKGKGIDEKTNKMMVVNLAIAYKSISQNKKCEDLINGTDWSASSPLFKVCANSVIENKGEVYKYLEAAKLSDGLSIESIRGWPAFKWMLKDEKFQDECRRVFAEPLFHDRQVAAKVHIDIGED